MRRLCFVGVYSNESVESKPFIFFNIIGGSVKKEKPVKVEACGDVGDVDDDEMEQEEMFVDPHESFEFPTREWGGPRRGGRFPEPTRYGDWERKGRCSDF